MACWVLLSNGAAAACRDQSDERVRGVIEHWNQISRVKVAEMMTACGLDERDWGMCCKARHWEQVIHVIYLNEIKIVTHIEKLGSPT